MKKRVTALFMLALAFGALQIPAQANISVSLFGRNDRDHDGRWDYRDFSDANRYYYQSHPGVQIVRRDYRGDFTRLDRDGDGYVTREDVRNYRNW